MRSLTILLVMTNKLKMSIALLLFTMLLSKSYGEKRLTSRVVTTINGLPTNRVNDMVQDRDGYLWFGTSNGLCRYDGYSFLVFPTMGVGAGQTNANVGTIHIDEKNQLMWLRSATFNYACYDLRRKKFVDYAGDCDPQRIFERFFPEEDGIWMYEAKAGIRHVTYRDGKFSCHDYTQEDGSLPPSRIKRLRPDNGGNMWILTDNGLLRADKQGRLKVLVDHGDFMMQNTWKDRVLVLTRDGWLLVFDLNGKRLHKLRMPQGLRDMGAVNGNIVWQDKWLIMTRTSVIAFDCRKLTFSIPDAYQMEYAIALDEHEGNFWVADKHGTLTLFPAVGPVKRFPLLHESGFDVKRKRNFSTIMGPGGKFYIATYGNGLFVYNPKDGSTTHYSASDKDPIIGTDYLTNIHRDNCGNIWIGQEEAGIVCLTELLLPETLHLLPDPMHPGGKSNYITRMIPQPGGGVLVETQSQDIYQYHPFTNTIQKTGRTVADNAVVDSLVDKRGRVWMAVWEKGLAMTGKARNGKLQSVSFLMHSTSESRITDLALDKNGILWAATYNGVYIIDTNAHEIDESGFGHMGVNEGLSSNSINCVLPSSDGYVWIGGQGTGIVKTTYDSSGKYTIETISNKQGLNSNNIQSLVEDHRGYIWAATDDGLSMLNPKTRQILRYKVGSTLLRSLYSEHCALSIHQGGTLLFGTHDGISIIKTGNMLFEHDKVRQATITDIDVNGKSIFNDEQYEDMCLLDNKITLAHNENSLMIHFSCFDYAHSERTMYQFYLEGIEKGWREPTTQHNVDYGNLPPGTYVFHLRTGENGEEKALRIVIRQPWYNTWWAWMTYLIIIGTGVAIFYRQKREQFKMRQQITIEKEVAEFRTNFFTQVAHEFRTPIAIISGAVDKLEDLGGGQRKPLQTAKRGVKRLSKLVNQLMEFRKINTGNLRLSVEPGELVGFVRDIYQDFWNAAQQKELQMTFVSSEKRCEMIFDRHLIDTIAYNLMSNAVKYTPQGGSVRVRLGSDNGQVVLTVEDSGPGIDDYRMQQLFKPFMHGYASQGGMGIGLYTAYMMAQTHKGTLTYKPSTALGGAKFTLTLPTNEAVYDASDYKHAEVVEDKSKADNQAEEVIKEMLPKALNDKTIAIIEDDLDMLEQIKAEVGVYFNVVGYTNGKSGLEGLQNEAPSLLICDVMLPDTNGYDIVKQMKADDSLKQIPVIMLTALDDEKHQIKGYEVGADDYMVKPCNYRILMARAIQFIQWKEERLHQEAATDKAESNEETASASPILTSQADKRFIDKVQAIVAQNIANSEFSVDMMAEQMHIGRTKLYGKVKELTGMSPNKLMVAERMRIAADMLEEGELNISEIAYKVGFPEASYFNKCFKQYYGMAPSKYRKEN